jgi:hypothetical protein
MIYGDGDLNSRRQFGQRVHHLAATIAYEEMACQLEQNKELAKNVYLHMRKKLNISLDVLLIDATQEERNQLKSKLNSLELTMAEIDKLRTII